MGSFVKEDEYSVPEETRKVLIEDIMQNPKINRFLPPEVSKYANTIEFEGCSSPSVPGNWRWAESISALKALEGSILCTIVERKYGVRPEKLKINTDHAQLFFMSSLLGTIDPDGENINFLNGLTDGQKKTVAKMFPCTDHYRPRATPYRACCTNIYKTKDSRFFNLHGDMNPDAILDELELPHEMDFPSIIEASEPYRAKLATVDSEAMQNKVDQMKNSGTICWTVDEYKASDHGKANAHINLFEIHEYPDPDLPPCWWTDTPQTSARRPLAGLKVVELSRVIAAPAIGRGLAEMGASVMRITAKHLPDMSSLHCDLNWGKWVCSLDLRDPVDNSTLKKLIEEADVVISGFRPHALDKYGLGMEDILAGAKARGRGIIYVRENCYGWNGPWKDRSGWQQISDSCCGVSMEFGRSMGNDEPVIPYFPNSDYSTGISGTCGVLLALLRRAEKGGSYSVDVALNYYSQWLIENCGTYPKDVWNQVWSKTGHRSYRHYQNPSMTAQETLSTLKKSSGDVLFRDEFFHDRDCKNLGVKIRTVKPVVQFPGGEVDLKFNVGTRTNGIDAARWPQDLMTEVVEPLSLHQ